MKPFVKRQKNDRADAEAIAKAALRPTMRFVAMKSAETQGRAVAFRTHLCLVRQRTQLINGPRGNLAEFGIMGPKGSAFAPDLDTFNSGRNFAAWLGLVPRQRSTGGKTWLGSVSEMGQTDIRRLLIAGSMSVIRWVVRTAALANRWLAALVAHKPRMVAAVALANKMARMIWAMTTKKEDYQMA